MAELIDLPIYFTVSEGQMNILDTTLEGMIEDSANVLERRWALRHPFCLLGGK